MIVQTYMYVCKVVLYGQPFSTAMSCPYRMVRAGHHLQVNPVQTTPTTGALAIP